MRKEIVSPMPGTVIEILVGKGDKVIQGQAAVVIESMKMENAIDIPGNGTVVDVLVAAQDTVSANQVMVVIE